MSKRRSLTEEEQKLWRSVVADIAPLRSRSVQAASGAPVGPENHPNPQKSHTPHQTTQKGKKPRRTPAELVAGSKSAGVRQPAQPPPARQTASVPAPGLDPRTLTKLRRGRQAIDATLDLHGLTAERAHARLTLFLEQCRHKGHKYVLIITGKGSRSPTRTGPEPGVLRRSVPHWLNTPPLKESVIGFHPAHHRSGGEGALYVSLRSGRPKKPQPKE